jgi:predicted transcriptional regulator
MSEASNVCDLTTEIVSAYVSGNAIAAVELPGLIQSVHAALSTAGETTVPVLKPTIKTTPSQVRKSITDDVLVSFIDGKSYKTLKRHLARHGMTVADYRLKFGLPKDYPTTAPSYSAMRSEMAKARGLGRKADNAPPKSSNKASKSARKAKGH